VFVFPVEQTSAKTAHHFDYVSPTFISVSVCFLWLVDVFNFG